jgi:hypothetical protein
MDGAPKDLTPTLARLARTGLVSVLPPCTWPTFAADDDVKARKDVGGMSPPVLRADDLFCRGA